MGSLRQQYHVVCVVITFILDVSRRRTARSTKEFSFSFCSGPSPSCCGDCVSDSSRESFRVPSPSSTVKLCPPTTFRQHASPTPPFDLFEHLIRIRTSIVSLCIPFLLLFYLLYINVSVRGGAAVLTILHGMVM